MKVRKKHRRASPEEKIAAVKACLSGETNPLEAGRVLGVSRSLVYTWVSVYRAHGEEGFTNSKLGKNKGHLYSREIMQAVVEEYLAGNGSQQQIAEKYKIYGSSIPDAWIEEYNRHGKILERGGLYMAAPRETTLEERIKIVEDCVASRTKYRAIAEKYGVSYEQVRYWVKKYDQYGVAGLEDRRGKRISQQEPRDEVEELKIRLAQAEQNIHLLKVERDLLKKALKVERGDL